MHDVLLKFLKAQKFFLIIDLFMWFIEFNSIFRGLAVLIPHISNPLDFRDAVVWNWSRSPVLMKVPDNICLLYFGTYRTCVLTAGRLLVGIYSSFLKL